MGLTQQTSDPYISQQEVGLYLLRAILAQEDLLRTQPAKGAWAAAERVVPQTACNNQPGACTWPLEGLSGREPLKEPLPPGALG